MKLSTLLASKGVYKIKDFIDILNDLINISEYIENYIKPQE